MTTPHYAYWNGVYSQLLLDDVVDEDGRGLDVLRGDGAGGDNLLGFDDDCVGGGGHHGAEVLAGAFVDEVAVLVADVGADDGDVGTDGFLEEVLLAVDGDFLFAVLDDGAEAGLGEHATEACAGGADLLGQGALGLEGDFQLAAVHLVDGVVVGADVGGDELFDLMVGDELADADFGIGGVVADDGEVLHVAGYELVDECDGVAHAEESSDHYGHAVLNFVGGFFY